MPQEKSIPDSRLAVLDGLRALAIVLVMARHFVRPFWEEAEAGLPFVKYILLNGWVGVDLFFVLSGFLITRQLLDGGGTLGAYYKRRFWRIAPLYYLVLTALAASIIPGLPAPAAENEGWRYVYHLLYLQNYLPSSISFVFWSLAVEVHFYLAAPFLVRGLKRLNALRARCAVLLGLLALMPLLRLITVAVMERSLENYRAYLDILRQPTHLCLDGLLVGALCAMLWGENSFRTYLEARPGAGRWLLGSGAGILLGLTGFMPLVGDGMIGLFDMVFLPSALGAGFGCMMLGLLAAQEGRMRNLFSSFLSGGIARISYGLYLVHLPVLLLLVTWMPDSPLPFLAFFYAVFSVLLATLLHLTMEQPLIRWAKRG